MNKKILAIAVAAVIGAPTAMADVTVYGKVRQAVSLVDMESVIDTDGGSGGDYVLDKEDFVEIHDNASRLGFKGSEDLGDGMKAVWQMEFGVAISNNDEDGSEFGTGNVISARNAFVGLAGDFGTVVVGRHDTPLKISTGWADPFADTAADYNNAWSGNIGPDFRADGTLAYISPSFSGLTFAGAVVPGENNQADGIADAYSLAAMYSNGGLQAALALEKGDSDIDALQGVVVEPDEYFEDDAETQPSDYKQWRAAVGYSMDAWSVGAMYSKVDFDGVEDDEYTETKSWNIFGTYTFGNNVLKVRYFQSDLEAGDASEEDRLDVERDGWAIGLDHNLSPRTQVYVLYSSADTDVALDEETDDAYIDSDDVISADTKIFSIGLNHSF